MSGLRLCVAAALALLPATQAFAQQAPAEILPMEYPDTDPPRDLLFTGLSIKFGPGQVQLVNGEEISASLWPALVIAQQSDTAFCSATLIGPRVLLTAAHCVDARNPAAKTATVGVVVTIPAGRFVAKKCDMHPDYAGADIPKRRADPRSSADYALCELGGEVTGTLFETLADTATHKGDAVLMSGYGCISIWVSANTIQFGAYDKALRMGMGVIDNAATNDSFDAPGTYLRSASVNKSPILCSGDSGGAMITGTTLDKATPSERRVAGVNSRVAALPGDGPPRFFSFMAPIVSPGFKKFLADWQADKNAIDRRVCGAGITPGDDNCRGGE